MLLTPSGALGKLRTAEGQKFLRYSIASVVAAVVSLVSIVFFKGVLGWAAWISSILATAIATVPNYHLNRKWAWGKSGKSHLMREVVPFWVLAAIGLGFSTVCSDGAEHWARHDSHFWNTVIVAVVYFGSFGVLWIAKFVIFNKILFVHHPEDLPEALDGRSGVPL